MKLDAARILEERGINYRVIELSDRALSINDVIRFSKEPLRVDEICKTMIVKDRTGKKYAIFLLGSDRVDFAKAGKVIGSKLSIANPREVKEVTGVEPGAVCPLLLKIPIYIDRRVTEKKRVNFGSGNHLYGIDVDFQDLAKVFEYTVVDVAEG
jgi:prolyl-tRNA editing enzyme YbaK/EbsC (Cys-tRNA(Pro) deacylase)